MFTGISAGNPSLYPRGGVFPAGHGYIRGKSSPIPARRRFSGWSRVYSREILSCTRAAAFFRLATGISAGNLPLYPRGGVFPAGLGYIRAESFLVPARRCFFRLGTGISAGNLSLYPRGGIFPAGHGYIRAESFPVPARRCFSGWPRVYSREIFPCTRAAAFFRPATGIFARNLSLYPRGGIFPAGHGYIRAEIFSCTRAAMFSRPATGIFARNPSLYPRGSIFPAGHGYIRGKSSPVPARRRFSGRSRVYSREIFSCTRAVVLFRPATGIVIRVPPRLRRGPPCYVSAGNLSLYL